LAAGHDWKVTTVAPVAAGTSTITGTALDMAGFEGAMFIVRLGTPATNNSLHLTQCDTSGGSYAAILGTSVGSHATDTPLIVDIYRPKEQYLKYVVTRGTSSTIDIVAIIQYGAGNRPTSQPSGTQIEHFYDTAEGTA
jgi:uncharacterized membrane-anchored protein